MSSEQAHPGESTGVDAELPPAGPPAPVRLIAIDLDGTLIRSDKRMSVKTVKAVQACAARGIRVVLATSRPPKSTRQIYKLLELDTLVINYNGALVQDPATGEFVHRCQLDRGLVLDLVDAARRVVANCMVRVDLPGRWVTDREGMAPQADDPRTPTPDQIGPFEEILTEDATRLAIVATPENLQNIYNVLERKFGDHFTLAHSNKRVMQMMHPDADKLNALMWVARQYDVPRESVMAIGDADNDHGMIVWAGWGVAMGNADDETKREADVVTATNDEDGVAKAILRYALGGEA